MVHAKYKLHPAIRVEICILKVSWMFRVQKHSRDVKDQAKIQRDRQIAANNSGRSRAEPISPRLSDGWHQLVCHSGPTKRAMGLCKRAVLLPAEEEGPASVTKSTCHAVSP